MSYIALTTSEIATGKPTAVSTLTKVKDNFDNHESRIGVLEVGGNVAYPPIIMRVNGWTGLAAVNGLLKTVTNFAITITGVRIYVETAGSAGTITCDIKSSSSGGAYASILTTLPSVGFASGNDAVSTNAVVNPAKANLLAGDLIRLDMTTVQTDLFGFMVRIDYNKT